MAAAAKPEIFSDNALKAENSASDMAMAEKGDSTVEGGLSDPNHVDLHRALKARHITMIGKRGCAWSFIHETYNRQLLVAPSARD